MSFTPGERKLLKKHHMLKDCFLCKREVMLGMAGDPKTKVLCEKCVAKGKDFDDVPTPA